MIKKITYYLFPSLVILFASIYFVDRPFYRLLVNEDYIVEWITFAFLFFTGIYSAILAFKIKQSYNYYHWFFILFAGFTLLAGFEEISWGQRVFGIESTEFFQKHSDQNEINLHNTFQGIFHIKTKHIALLAMLVWGVILPWRQQKGKQDFKWLKDHDRHFIIPPHFLIPAFLMGAILMLDFQTGYEEEFGEMFFSICFFLMIAWNNVLFKTGQKFALDGQKPIVSASRPSFREKADILIPGKLSSPRI
ncbi:hypothetical protein [Pedobacter sp. SYSU D00535]|uniref:hypothetical protein n=1 Tax=Pedobacter sp. SYSU D00535 TaxID=2810308 RepID=UPI001A959894|nr:hypothetical protein [Pedobacter sp. SYSU D00535]